MRVRCRQCYCGSLSVPQRSGGFSDILCKYSSDILPNYRLWETTYDMYRLFMFWSICTLESIYCSSEKFFWQHSYLIHTHTMYLFMYFKYTGLQVLEHKKQWRIIKSVCPCLVLINGGLLGGARTVGLVIRGLYAISCINTDGVSFILLSCWLGVSRKDFNLCECCILKSVELWTPACAQN